MSTGFALTVRFSLRDTESAQQFDALVARTAEGIRTEPGTLVYVAHTPVDEPLVRVFYELYADRAAFQAHEEQTHTRHFLKTREQFLTGTDVVFLNELEQLSKRPGTEGP
ncbi:antibiotic biosynthesis monooxygenase [Streptomyces sp. H27-H1]|uniref:putative quinol monooxygenase n=1 Tax=Streptomyces sp. H27-H1 TaxID=2996461 RepID=UPI00226E6709|nr:antibiotic biosynthesis monooxygenase [Streptomyces sp. H27-H1]MCY0930886.1 antibiotic biosynthesis monooxygenase [Streptomyces sp. H27-H1]